MGPPLWAHRLQQFYDIAMRLWSLSGVTGAPFFPGAGIHGGFLRSLVPIAAWLNPLLTTGYAVEISKYFNMQPRGMQNWLEAAVASGLSMDEAPSVQGWELWDGSRSRRREAGKEACNLREWDHIAVHQRARRDK